ncbi:Uncharacterized protein TCM_038826 [Theobroma cacao]|uniref:Uncharacterized protein n=1 Tax=Theobroma cacao TaxID=3641 RepID=A0A061GQF1_THECC|nr:Uncharacterized protein TCM_038826 [Theobroma cacao]
MDDIFLLYSVFSREIIAHLYHCSSSHKKGCGCAHSSPRNGLFPLPFRCSTLSLVDLAPISGR